MILEMCIDSVESAIASAEGGASRVEFCANLLEGGTTPSLGAIRETKRKADIPLSVMVRPRGGDFCHTDEEFAVMAEDVRIFKEEGVDAVVFGLLTPEATIDVERTKALIEQARPLQVTFHRAFDMTRDPFEALDTLIELGVDRILTSGQEPSVFEGSDLIRRLIEHATGRIIIMPGCGITLKNVQRVIAETGANEIHVAAPAAQPSLMTFQNDEVFMGTALRSEEYMRYVTPAESVRQFRSKVNP
ncbi:MAG: copper homeostasis protein [Verrucomicrobiales bacterium]|jgi:copper homeostasis protein